MRHEVGHLVRRRFSILFRDLDIQICNHFVDVFPQAVGFDELFLRDIGDVDDRELVIIAAGSCDHSARRVSIGSVRAARRAGR
jgi:hypothetical protein